MNKYEAMFIVKPDLSDADKKSLFTQIGEAVLKNNGNVSQANIWSEKRKMHFSIKQYHEGIYYLMNFTIAPDAVAKLKQIYKLNENILRVLITKTN